MRSYFFYCLFLDNKQRSYNYTAFFIWFFTEYERYYWSWHKCDYLRSVWFFLYDFSLKYQAIYCFLKFNQFCWIRTFLVYLLCSLTTFTYSKMNIFTYLLRHCSCQFLLLNIEAIVLWLENTMIFCPFNLKPWIRGPSYKYFN